MVHKIAWHLGDALVAITNVSRLAALVIALWYPGSVS
jgi:hypothetical protein